MEMVLTKLRAKEVDIFVTGVSYRVSEDKKSIELMATSTHSVWGDINWIVGRIKKSFGEVQAFGVGQKGERREYKTIKGVNNFLLKEYRYGVTNEKLKELFDSLTDSDSIAEEKNNSINVINEIRLLSAGTVLTLAKEEKLIDTNSYAEVEKVVDLWLDFAEKDHLSDNWKQSWKNFINHMKSENTEEVIEEERKIKNYTDEEVETLCTEGKWRRVKKLHKRLNEIKLAEKNSIVEVIINTEKNGIELYFKGKPSEEVRKNLKDNGFRWTRFNKCWYCKDSEEKREFLRKIGYLEVDTEKKSIEQALEKNSVEVTEKNSVEVIEIKNNISHVVNTSCITKGTMWSIKRYDNFIKCFRIDEKGDPVILHNEQIKLNINLLDFNRLVEDGNIIIPQTNQIEEQATSKAKGVEPKAVAGENKYPKIDINDIEKYTIDKSISDRENNRAFFRSSYINHTEELQEYFLSTNKAVEGIINNPLCTEKIRYGACKYLQSFKEKYYKAYKDYLIVKGNTPSWMETGRGNLNSRRYSKAHDRVDKKLLKVTDLVEKFNNKMKSFRLELKGIKEGIEKNTLLDILKNTEPVSFKRVKKAINRTSTGNIFDNADFESMVYTSDNNHYIIKLWGNFRLYNGSGEAMYNTGFETLRDAKKYMTYLLSN